MGFVRWTYWPIIVFGIIGLLGGIGLAAPQATDAAERPQVAVPYFVQGSEAVKDLATACIRESSEFAARLRVGVSLAASLGRFCDRDEPFEAIIHNTKPTQREKLLLSRVFPSDSTQPQCIFLGQWRLIAIVHPSNPVKTLDVSQIQEILKKDGPVRTWGKVGGSARSIRIYDQGPKSWSRHILRMRCMAFERKAGQGIMKGWYDFRKDIEEVLDEDAAVVRVRRDPNAICFVMYRGQALKGVSVIPISPAAGLLGIVPKLKPTIQENRPMAEPLFLWVHPKASEATRGFAKFVASKDGALVLERHGFITPWHEHQ